MAQNECEISQNLNKINDDDANKKLQHNWCPGNQTKCRGETVAVSGCDQIFMEGKAESCCLDKVSDILALLALNGDSEPLAPG